MSPSNPSSRRVTAAVPPAREAPTITIGACFMTTYFLRPEGVGRDNQFGERRKGAALSSGEARDDVEDAFGQSVRLDAPLVGVYDPVVRDPVARIQLELRAPVDLRRAR